MVWASQPYNWHLCYSTEYYNVYVPSEKDCLVALGPTGTRAIRPNGPYTARILPRFGLRDCLGGPSTPASDICLDMYNRDGDDSITMRDVAIWMNAND